jgi:hypothetical protein
MSEVYKRLQASDSNSVFLTDPNPAHPASLEETVWLYVVEYVE